MSLKIQALKNVASSWAGLATSVAVGFFLSPFILHRLGDDAFGLWILVFSVTGYYGLFDFGIRSSLVRYVAKFKATGEVDELSRLFNTSLLSYGCVGLFLLALTTMGSLYVDRIFHIPAGLRADAPILFLIVGSALALGFPLGIAGGILEGLQRFYVINATQIVFTLVRAVLIVLALWHGLGLKTVTLITAALPLFASAVNFVLVRHILHLPYGLRYVNRATFRQVADYGSVTFMIILAARLRFKTDAVIIGSFLSASAITYFSIGARLVDYAGEVVSGLAQIFTPMSSHFHAAGDESRLRQILLAGNRACALTMFPICTVLIVVGKSVIEAWVGARYVSSYQVLLILLLPSTLYYAQATSTRILFGMSRHRTLAIVVLAEGIANVILSIILIRPLGIVGDAIGTAIPLACTALFFLPRHLCRQLGVPLRTFLRESFLLPAVICFPMAGAMALMQHLFYAHGFRQLVLNLLPGLGVYSVGLLWLFLAHEPSAARLRGLASDYRQQAGR